MLVILPQAYTFGQSTSNYIYNKNIESNAIESNTEISRAVEYTFIHNSNYQFRSDPYNQYRAKYSPNILPSIENYGNIKYYSRENASNYSEYFVSPEEPPRSPINIQIRCNKSIRVNETFELKITLQTSIDISTAKIKIDLPHTFKVLSGETDIKEESIVAGVPSTYTLSVKPLSRGTWGIEAWVYTNEGYSGYSCCTVYVDVSVTPETIAQAKEGLSTNIIEHHNAPGVKSPGTTLVWGYWYYKDGSGNIKPVRYATVKIWDEDTFGDDLLATTYTDANGYYSAVIDNNDGEGGTQDVYIEVYTETQAVIVKTTDNKVYVTYTSTTYDIPDGTWYAGSWLVADSQRGGFFIMDTVIDGYQWLDNQVGWTRSQVTAYWPAANADDAYSTGDAFYIGSNYQFSRPTILHEYAHCIHYEANGGSFPPGSGPSPHYMDSESSGGFALTEGWAEFFPCAVDNTPDCPWGGSLESTVYADGPFGHGDYGDWDGDIVEGAVANIFWDIFDGVSSSDHPSWSNYGDYIDGQFSKLWNILLNYRPQDINEFWDYWISLYGADANIWGIFYNARINKDSSPPTNPTSYYSNPSSGVWTNDNTIYVEWYGASDDLSGVYGYGLWWSTSPGLPSAVVDTTNNYATSSPLSDGVWYLNIRTVDRAGNWNSGYVYCGPFYIDTTAPSSSITSISGTYYNGWYKDSVSITISASDSHSGVYRIYYRWYKQGSSPPQWSYSTGSTASFTITANAGTGTYVLEYYAQDNAGNVEGTNTYSVKIDTSAPSSGHSLSGTMGDNGWYTSSVSVTISASDSGVGVDYIKYRIDSGNWITYYGTSVSFTISSNGQHTVEYYAVDKLGHASSTKSVSFKIDTTKPSSTISLSGTSLGGWYKDSVSATVSASDTYSGVYRIYYRYYKQGTSPPSWSYYTGSSVTFAVYGNKGTGTYIIEYYAVDNAGNVESAKTYSVKIDTSSPSSSHSLAGTLGDNDWYTSSVSVTISASDSGVGVNYIKYRIDYGTWQTYYGASVAFTLTNDGEHTVEYYAVDKFGHQESTHTVTIKIDKTPPSECSFDVSGTLGNNDWYISTVYVSISSADETSGISRIMYRINSGSWNTYTGTIQLSSTGTYIIEAYAVDNAGHQGSTSQIQVKVDVDPPLSSHTIVEGNLGDNGWYTSQVTISLEANDVGSGVDAIYYSIDGSQYVQYTQAFTIEGDGQHTLRYYATDIAGNVETTHEVIIGIDSTPPTADLVITSGTVGNNNWYISSVTFEIVGDDSTSGVAVIEYSINNGPWQTYSGPVALSASGVYNISYRAKDNAGNIGSTQVDVIRIDVDPPDTQLNIVDYTSTYSSWYSGNVTIELVATDSHSGVSKIYYKINDSAWLLYEGYLVLSESGVYNIYYKAVDNAGNEETEELYTLKIDNTPPITWITNVPSEVGTDTFLIEFNYTETQSGSSHVELYYRIGNGNWVFYGNFTVSPITFVAPSDGTYYLMLIGVDNIGNREQKSDYDASVFVDFSPPIIEILVPENLSYVNSSSVYIEWNATDLGSGINIIKLYLNGTYIISSSQPHGSHTIDVSDWGWYNVTLYVVDNLGHSKNVSVYVFVDYIAPYIEIEYPIDGEIYNVSSITVSWSAYDNESGYMETHLYVNDTLLDIISSATYTYTIEFSSDGWYVIRLIAYDKAGNKQQDTVTIGIDSHPPVIQQISPANHTVTSKDTLVVEVLAYDAMGMGYVQFELDGELVKIDYEPPYSAELDLSGKSDGEHIVNIILVDASGHSKSVRLIIVIDRQPPTINISGVNNESIVFGLLTLNITIDDNVQPSNATIYIDDDILYSGSNTSIHLEIDTLAYDDGMHIVIINATDRAGNANVSRLVLVFDNNAPEVELLYPSNNSWLSYNNVTLKLNIYDATNVNITILVDGTLYYSQIVSAGYIEVAIVFEESYEGEHRILMNFEDEVGHTTQSSIILTVDLTAPEISIPAPRMNVSSLPVTIRFNVSDNFVVDTIVVYLDNKSTVVAEYENLNTSSMSVEISLENIPPGEHTLLIYARDKAGNDVEKHIIVDYKPETGGPPAGIGSIVYIATIILIAIIVVASVLYMRRRKRFIEMEL